MVTKTPVYAEFNGWSYMGRLGQPLMVVANIGLIYSSGMAPIKPLKR